MVAFAREKPVWVGSVAVGLRVSAERVFAAACALVSELYTVFMMKMGYRARNLRGV